LISDGFFFKHGTSSLHQKQPAVLNEAMRLPVVAAGEILIEISACGVSRLRMTIPFEREPP